MSSDNTFCTLYVYCCDATPTLVNVPVDNVYCPFTSNFKDSSTPLFLRYVICAFGVPVNNTCPWEPEHNAGRLVTLTLGKLKTTTSLRADNNWLQIGEPALPGSSCFLILSSINTLFTVSDGVVSTAVPVAPKLTVFLTPSSK